MREILRGEELPAQWRKYSLKTQQEMMSGRDALHGAGMYKWIGEGVVFLNEQFRDKGLDFSTATDIEKCEVLLRVWKKSDPRALSQLVFEVVEPVQYFVSRLTVTKIIMIAG